MTILNVTNVTIATECTDPLRARLEINCAGTVSKFQINEDLAHQLCSGLDRFLTQVTRRPRLVRLG
ncbi:hypothetical protein UP10_16320 [Bradyrhizobium sp. LTSPM299]|uniref:hypothetical protein n=1 Tax=Bradyrhizobium sp. LTSPM299 TaxID=1619233 RepID=UPI0005CA9E89|nr:hypothetical protein [Bradyrhizobium sp. LTSPM299]KJC59715.1 hypothetical protein UP10_16320 [Bradyrhizobium sp. LTSPM299]